MDRHGDEVAQSGRKLDVLVDVSGFLVFGCEFPTFHNKHVEVLSLWLQGGNNA